MDEKKKSEGELSKNKKHKACQKMTVVYIIYVTTDKFYWLRLCLKLFSDQFVIQIFNQRYSLFDPNI